KHLCLAFPDTNRPRSFPRGKRACSRSPSPNRPLLQPRFHITIPPPPTLVLNVTFPTDPAPPTDTLLPSPVGRLLAGANAPHHGARAISPFTAENRQPNAYRKP